MIVKYRYLEGRERNKTEYEVFGIVFQEGDGPVTFFDELTNYRFLGAVDIRFLTASDLVKDASRYEIVYLTSVITERVSDVEADRWRTETLLPERQEYWSREAEKAKQKTAEKAALDERFIHNEDEAVKYYHLDDEIKERLEALSGGAIIGVGSGGGAEWGGITGVLSAQGDLAAALGGKADVGHNHDGVYADVVHSHNDLYYTESEVDSALAGKSDVGHNHDTDYAALSHDHNDLYYTEAEVDSALSGKADTSHTHDDRYYTEGETDSLLDGKADSDHNHDVSYAAIDHNHNDTYYTEDEVDSALAGKSDVGHSHTVSDITDFPGFQVDSSTGGGTYGTLSGTIDDSNTTFTVSQGSYVSGSLKVWVNGILELQDTDWSETTPGSGTFDFVDPPASGQNIIAEYRY